MNLPRLFTFAACFAVIYNSTKPDHQMTTLAAIMVVCLLVAFHLPERRP